MPPRRYMGSLGGDFSDYYVTDKVITPPELREQLVEKVAYVRESYMVNDHRSLHPEDSSLPALHEDRAAYTRTYRPRFGLPVDAFIYCNFNQMYKIEPAIFDAWMHILASTDNSVLWLQSFNDDVKPNLQRRAAAFGVDESRIIFTNRVDTHAHVFMKSLADLHLDTSVFNGMITQVGIRVRARTDEARAFVCSALDRARPLVGCGAGSHTASRSHGGTGGRLAPLIARMLARADAEPRRVRRACDPRGPLPSRYRPAPTERAERTWERAALQSRAVGRPLRAAEPDDVRDFVLGRPRISRRNDARAARCC